MEVDEKEYTDEIYLELQRVLNFPSFKNSPILSRFLEYIVTETINKRHHHIKEYSVAVHVLDRAPTFNPHDDAIVRIHAGRLRRILADYYVIEGINNPIIISIPKGCYIPEFNSNKKIPPKESVKDNANPTIAIFPFKPVIQKEKLEIFSLMLSEEISAELSRFEDISVIAHFSQDIISKINENTLEAAKFIGTDFFITGYLQCNEKKIQIRVNVLNTLTGKFIMTQLFEREYIEDVIEIQNEIVQNIVSAIGGYYGIIFKEIIKTSPAKIADNSSVLKGIYSYYRFQRSYSVENYELAISNLKEAVKLHPNHAATWAMLGEFHLDGLALAINNNYEDTIDEAYRCVMKALKIDPNCQHAWHTLAWVSLFKREPEECLYAAEQCIKINSNASGMVSGVGCMMIFAGYFEKGFLIMDHAIQTNPCYPWWINIGYSYYYIYKKDYTNAFYWADKMESEETFWDPLLKAVSLSFMNEDEKAKKHLTKLLEIKPQISKEIKNMLSSYILSDDVIMNIIGSLVNIGLEVYV